MQDEVSLILIAIIRSNSFDKVENCIANGDDVNQVYKGKSLLEYAIQKGNLEIIQLLVDNDAKYDKISVLEQSIANEEPHISNYFMSLWEDLNEIYNNTYPIIHAIKNGNLKLVKLLKQHGASLNKVDPNISIEIKNFDVLQAFLEAGGNPNTKVDGSPLLTYSINLGKVEYSKILTKYGAKIELILNDTNLKLDWNNTNITLSYIEAGGNINQKYNGLFPLEHALQNKNQEVVNILKENGAKPNDLKLKQKQKSKIIHETQEFKDSPINPCTDAKPIKYNYEQEWQIFELFSMIGISATIIWTFFTLNRRYSLEKTIYEEKRADNLLKAFNNLLKIKNKDFDTLHDGAQKILIDHTDKFPGLTKSLVEKTLDIYNSHHSKIKSYSSVTSTKSMLKINTEKFHQALEEICKKIPEIVEFSTIEKAAMNIAFECPLIILANVVSLIGVAASATHDYYYPTHDCS